MAKRQKPTKKSELVQQELIKKLIIIALFADDELMERFVLKGGNAIDIIHHTGTRASYDIDVSMADDFEPGQLEAVRSRLEKNLRETFQPEGYTPFDVTLSSRPENVAPEDTGFWGGYGRSSSSSSPQCSISSGMTGQLFSGRRSRLVLK